jgi:hypothetical protein
MVDRKGNKDVRVSDHVVVEEVLGIGLELIEIDRPTSHWNGDTDFILLVAFALERQEAKPLLDRKVCERARHRRQRRRLIVAAVVAADHPLPAGHSHSRANPRVGGVLGQHPVEVCHSETTVDRQPVCHRVLILREEDLLVSRRRLRLRKRRCSNRLQPEQDVVVLIEAIHSDASGVLSPRSSQDRLGPDVLRRPMIGRDNRIIGPSVERRSVVVVERGDGKEGSRTNRAEPRHVHESIPLTLMVVDAGRLVVRTVRDLVVIG